jgi:hypothetical protein
MADVHRERRKAARVQANTIRELDLRTTVPVEILDVSENGVLAKSSAPLATARRCRLRLKLGDRPFVAEVSVTRCRHSTPGGDGYRIAAVFTGMTEENRRTLHQFLERASARQ